MAYPILIIKAERAKALHNRHPWLFSGAVAQKPGAHAGAIIRVADTLGHSWGYGFYDNRGEIVCKMFDWSTDDDKHFDAGYWKQKLHIAHTLRQQVVDRTHTNCYRLVHAEGDNWPGFIADVYGDVVVCQVLHKGVEGVFPYIKEALLEQGFKHIYCKTKTGDHNENKISIDGWQTDTAPQPLQVTENGLHFYVNVETGQKTGFFIDQRDSRALLKTYSRDKRVLNTFSYTGGFSIYAEAGGAKEVVSVDSSKEAVDMCHTNAELNFGSNTIHKGICTDVFDYMKQADDVYDIIVLDPPAFAKNARSVPNAARGYKELNIKGIQKLAPGGMLFTFSCSKNIDKHLFRQIVFSAAADAGRAVKILHQLTQPADHPINIYHPEGEYLKGLVLSVE